jgi:hypothetical protein
MGWKNEVWLGAGMRRSQGGPLFVSRPHTVHVCIYVVRGPDLEVGTFVRGVRLQPEQTRRLLRAMTPPGLRGSCPNVRTFAVVEAGPGLAVNMELGGCWRVVRPYPNNGYGSADPQVVRAVLGLN